MTNEELKKKICKIIADNYLPKEMPDRLEDYKLYRFARAAGALIEAGLKFDTVVSHTATFDLAQQEYINSLERRCAQAEHRAEVAERALLLACANVVKDEKDDVDIELLVRVVYDKYLKQAERELAEEGTDE